MDNKNNNKTHIKKSLISQDGSDNQYTQSGIYLRDDHCDWGSSGMNDLIKSLDDNN